MHFLLVNRFFGGDQVPTGRMLADVATQLLKRGAHVTVVSSSSRYANETQPELVSNLKVIRLWGCSKLPVALAWTLYLIQAAILIPFLKWDRCLLLTDPPFLFALSPILKLLRPRRKVFLWTMDLYPEALVADKLLKEQGLSYQILRFLNNVCLGYLDGVIALGNFQVHRLRTYSNWTRLELNYRIVPPWDDRVLIKDEKMVAQLKQRFGWVDRRILLYAGNLGRGHSYRDVIKAAELSDELRDDWVYAFFCRGHNRPELEAESAHLDNVVILDYVPMSETAALLHSANVHLVTMADGWEGIVVPSKLYGVLSTCAPILFIGPEQSDTACEIERLEVGAALPNGSNARKIVDTLNRLAESCIPRARENDGVSASRVAEFISVTSVRL